MLYLDYAKPIANGKYILSFFADSAADLESISHGQKFVTKNGTDYGVPQAGSTVIVTSPEFRQTTYVMDAEGVWVVTEDISYSAVVANPSDAATAKLEKLKVNDTTYANWTESEIKALASGKAYYKHEFKISSGVPDYMEVVTLTVINHSAEKLNFSSLDDILSNAITRKYSIYKGYKESYYELERVAYNAELKKLVIYYFQAYPFTPDNHAISTATTFTSTDDVTEL